MNEGDDVGGRVLLVGEHLPAGHADDADHVGRGGQPGFQAGRGIGGEQLNGSSRSEVDALGGQRVGNPLGVMLVGGQDRCDARCRGTRCTMGQIAQQAWVGVAVPVERGHLDGLATLGIDDLQPVACA